MTQLPHYLSFLLGNGQNSLHLELYKNSNKKLYSVPSDLKTPMTHLFRLPVCLWCTSNCPNFVKYMYIFSQILHFSSNRKARNSAHPFQFVTPGRELHPKSTKNPNFEDWRIQNRMNFWDQQFIWDPENPLNQQKNRQTSSRIPSLTPKMHQESTIL